MTDKAFLKSLQLFHTKSRSRSTRIIVRLTFALALLPVMFFCGCTEEKSKGPEPARPELRRIVDGLNQHYQSAPPGNNWKISAITAQGNQILITVDIPPDQASQIMRQPADTQFRLVAEQICPGNDHAVWRQLPYGSTITLLPSVSRQVFIEVACSHH